MEHTQEPENTSAPSGNRTWLIAVVVLLFVVYPAIRWVMNRNAAPSTATAPASTTAPPPAAAAAAMADSFRAHQAGKFDDAIAFAKKALEADPNLADAYNNIAVSYLGLKQYDQAIAAAQDALRLKPDYQLAKNNLAWIQQEKTKAMRPALPPDVVQKVGVLLNQSLAQTQAKQYPECITTASEAAKLDPNSAGAVNNIAVCQALLGRWNDALSNVQRAVQLDPALQIAKNNLAWIQQEQAKAAK